MTLGLTSLVESAEEDEGTTVLFGEPLGSVLSHHEVVYSYSIICQQLTYLRGATVAPVGVRGGRGWAWWAGACSRCETRDS